VCTIRPGSGGIQFRRAGSDASPAIPALAANHSAGAVHPPVDRLPPRNTSLALPGSSRPAAVTVEHLLSVLAGLGITDALIDLAGDEVPIGDGSGAFIVEAVRRAGVADAPGAPDPLTLTGPIVVSDPSGARIEASPADRPHYTYHLDYGPDIAVPPQSASWAGDPDDYATNVAPARTFCLEAEARAMQSLGLFKALTPRDMLVFGPEGPIDNTLRFPNEPARHKLLDLIGDLSLAGRPIHARITATRSGHALNHEMARALADLAHP
jgi:UDP-3-O-acyl-N-acetylglucosamine deacetylase